MAIEITRTHHTDRATARRHVESFAEHLSSKLKIRYGWEGDRLTFKRTGAKGAVEVDDAHVHVHVTRGKLLPVSETWLRAQIEEELDRYFPPPA